MEGTGTMVGGRGLESRNVEWLRHNPRHNFSASCEDDKRLPREPGPKVVQLWTEELREVMKFKESKCLDLIKQ
jgi:hypothetical protein